MQADLSPTPNTRLTNERLSLHWTQCEVAAFVGTTKLNVGRWERGQTFPGPYFRRRLCEVFGKTVQELGLAATSGWTALYDPAIPLLRPTPTHLVGRTALLNTLKERLTGGVSPLLYLALSGLPGVGKTTLAVALAHTLQVREHFADGMLWVGLGPTPDVLGQLSRWGTLLSIAAPQEKAPGEGLEAWSLALRKALWQRRMLLVIDDAWSLQDALAFRVGGPQCSYIMTTRFVDMATQFAWDGATKVGELDEEDGMTLLAKLAPAAVEHDPGSARALVQAVGGLPLALTLMGNNLRKQGAHPRRIQQALACLLESKERLELCQPQPVLDRHSSLAQGSALSLQAVISASDDILSPAAHQALAGLAVFLPKPNTFSETAALAVSGADVATLDALVDAGLLEYRGSTRLCLHQTIADYAWQLLMREGEREVARGRMVAYFQGYVEEHERSYEALAQESANIQAALHIACEDGPHLSAALVQLTTGFYPYLATRGLYASAQEDLLRAGQAARSLGEPAALSRVLLQLGEIAQKQGRS